MRFYLRVLLPVAFIALLSLALWIGNSQSRRAGAQGVAEPSPAGGVSFAAAAGPAPYSARKLCTLEDRRIDESSGLAASRRYPGLLWTHNDSGDTARAFLIDRQGKTVAELRLQGADAVDWEDVAIAGKGEDAWVYAGDIGDNLHRRKDIVVYRFREPALDMKNLNATLDVPCESMTLTYPDAPHDAETLVATTTGELIIVTKSGLGSQIFKTPGAFAAGATQQLVQVGEFRFGDHAKHSSLATGGDLSPDETRLVIRTYTDAYEWTLPRADPWHAVWKTTPGVWALPRQPQGEGICYGSDGRSLYLSSEQLPTDIYELEPRAALKKSNFTQPQRR